MTQSSVWRLIDGRAHLSLGDVEATIRTAQPALGLHDLRIGGHSTAAAHLLAPRFSGHDAQRPQVVGESFVRGRDLIVTYPQVNGGSVRMQVYWRAIEASAVPDCLAALDVLISVQTSRLAADPALVITSGLPTREVTRLNVPDLTDEARPTDGGAQLAPADCWVCHWPSPGFTYGEMVHPADFHHVALLTDDAADGAQSELVHHLFPQEIEKGVILRARARGVFAKGPRGAAAVAAAYREFLSCPLPLTA